MHKIILLIIILFIIRLIIEICIIFSQGLYHYIHGYGYNLLCDEIKNGYVDDSENMIHLRCSTQLRGRYIADTKLCILFPYHLSNDTYYAYGILIFSKEYYLIKNTLKQKKNEMSPKRIKFN